MEVDGFRGSCRAELMDRAALVNEWGYSQCLKTCTNLFRGN
jgi:hypothetical protein